MTAPTFKQAAKEHTDAIRRQAILIGNATTNYETKRLRKIWRAERDELIDLIEKQLTQSSDEYSVQTEAMKAISDDLKWLKGRIDDFADTAETATKVLGYIARFLPLLV